MASYVRAVLAEGEKLVYSARLTHWKFFIHYLVGACLMAAAVSAYVLDIPDPGFAAIAASIVFALGVAVVLYAVIKRSTTELVLTNRRFFVKTGLVARDTVEMNLSKVESLRVSQSLMGRVLNYGDVTVVGTGSSLEPIRGIADPLELRRKIGEIQQT